MEYTIREKIIKELYDLYDEFVFESISDPTLHRGRQIFDVNIEPPPIIAILPRIEEGIPADYGMQDLKMPVDIICLAQIGEENPSELGEAILGELIACAFGKETEGADGRPEKYGGLTDTYADSIMYRTGGIDAYPDELGQQVLHVGITVDIRYQIKAGNPYSQED